MGDGATSACILAVLWWGEELHFPFLEVKFNKDFSLAEIIHKK